MAYHYSEQVYEPRLEPVTSGYWHALCQLIIKIVEKKIMYITVVIKVVGTHTIWLRFSWMNYFVSLLLDIAACKL